MIRYDMVRYNILCYDIWYDIWNELTDNNKSQWKLLGKYANLYSLEKNKIVEIEDNAVISADVELIAAEKITANNKPIKPTGK